jgi:hypothetical protein
MPWDLNLEIKDPEIYIQQLPTIIKHIPYSKDYKIQLVMTLWNLIDTNGHSLVIENLELAVFSTLVQGSFYNTLEPPIIKVSEISIARVREAAEYIRANIKKVRSED